MSFLTGKDKKISPEITGETMGKRLNNAILLAHSQSGSETGHYGNGTIDNQIVVKGPNDPPAHVGTGNDRVIHFTKDHKEYQFKLETFEKLLDQLLPYLSSSVNDLTGEAAEAYMAVRGAVEQIKTYSPGSYPRIVELVKAKYGSLHPNRVQNSLYSYFMGCAKTGELGVCSPNCAGGIAHDHKNECGDVVFVFEANELLHPINKLKKGRHVYIYIDPETFTSFNEKHVGSLKKFDVEEVTVLSKSGADTESFHQQVYPIDQLHLHKSPQKVENKPKHGHGQGHDHDHGNGNKENENSPTSWLNVILTVLVIIVIIALIAVIVYYVTLINTINARTRLIEDVYQRAKQGIITSFDIPHNE